MDENTRRALHELSEQLAHGRAPASEICPKTQLAEWIRAEQAAKARKREQEFCNCSHCVATRRQNKINRLSDLPSMIVKRNPGHFIPELDPNYEKWH
jgi:hypothetical protein